MGGGDNSTSPVPEKLTQSAAGDEVTVNIRCSNGSKFSVQTNLDSTVDSFKALLARHCDISSDQQRLIYKGRILKADQTLQSYGLEEDHTVHLVRGFASPPPMTATTNAAGSVGSEAANTTQDNSTAIGLNEAGAFGGAGLGASLFPGLGFGGLDGSAGLFGVGLPDIEQMQQQLTRNPNIMREIMDMPAMQSLMNNPEILRNIIMDNSQMREIIDRNPEFAHILNDPNTLHQTLEAARNPELMREMMRTTDRAMSNIESSPEGFNMLRRMYENVQEPFLNATTMAGNTGNDSPNPLAALLGTQGGNQARDGSMNQSIPTSGTATTGTPAPNTNPLPNPWSSASTGGVQTNSTRSSPSVDATPQAPAGLGGLGLEGIFGASMDDNFINQLLQSPTISQMMQSLLSNPQYIQQVLGLNPQLQSTLDSNSQLREMMQNPEFLRQLTSPETMQQLLTLQQSLLAQLTRSTSTQESTQTGGTGGLNNSGLEALMTMFGGLGAGSLAVPNRSDVPPEQLYATQLSQLQEMGFIDIRENIQALMATAGNVHAAVERLLGNSDAPVRPEELLKQTVSNVETKQQQEQQTPGVPLEDETKSPIHGSTSDSPALIYRAGMKRGREEEAGRSKVEMQPFPSGTPTCYVCKRTFLSWKGVFGHLKAHPNRDAPGAFPPPTFTPRPPEKDNNGENDKSNSLERKLPTLLNLASGTMEVLSVNVTKRGLDVDLNEPKMNFFDLNEMPAPPNEDPEEDNKIEDDEN